MTTSSENALEFNRRLFGLAERMAAVNIVIARLHCDWSSFGSWDLQAQLGAEADRYAAALRNNSHDTAGPDVLSFSWDGRDKVLSVEKAPTPALSAPTPWRRLDDHHFASSDEAMLFVENYLMRELGES
jgi:hypothetical protein